MYSIKIKTTSTMIILELILMNSYHLDRKINFEISELQVNAYSVV